MKEKKKLFSKQSMVSVFIIVIMISSVLGYMFGRDSGEMVKYGDYKFYRKGAAWGLKIDKQELLFDFAPIEVEGLTMSSGAVEKLKDVLEIDMTSDINDTYAGEIAQAQFNMQETLGLVSGIYIRTGMTEENEFELPVITCKDATAAVPVLYLMKSNTTKISLDGDCIIGEARSEIDILRIKDRLLYGALGII